MPKCTPEASAPDKQTALRNRRIRAAYTRKHNPPTQEELAIKYGVSQATISRIVNNPCSEVVRA